MAAPPSTFREVEAYGQELLIAIGVVSLRAGHLEDYLTFFMASVGKMPVQQAQSIFYSTVSAKARLDMIRALLGVPGFSVERAKIAEKLLDRAKRLFDRRNNLVHGQYMISQTGAEEGRPPLPPKQILVQRRTATKTPFASRPVTFKEVEQLARDYEDLRLDLWYFHVNRPRPP